MKNMDKGLTVPKWVLITWPKIPQMPQNLSAQIVCASPKVWDFDKKRLHWASVVRGTDHDGQRYQFQAKQGTIEIYQLRSAQKTHH